ncbi:MAG: hypothetical protein PHQ75_03375 [Thermoguttaceae bacterium]|nr:hypothetical protein [Thermoguttaceae bacterium]
MAKSIAVRITVRNSSTVPVAIMVRAHTVAGTECSKRRNMSR